MMSIDWSTSSLPEEISGGSGTRSPDAGTPNVWVSVSIGSGLPRENIGKSEKGKLSRGGSRNAGVITNAVMTANAA
jgi:hypothetical protein